MYNVGDEVEFTYKCDPHWFFGPHTDNKIGVILRLTPNYYFKYSVRTANGMHGGVSDEHITLVLKTIPYTELQTGDTDEDI